MNYLILGTDVFSKGGIQRYTRYQFRAIGECCGFDKVGLYSLMPPRQGNEFEVPIDVDYSGQGLSLVSKIKYTFSVLSRVSKSRSTVLLITHVQFAVIGLIAKWLFGTRYILNVYGLEVWDLRRLKDMLGLRRADAVIGDCNFVINYIRNKYNYSGNTLLLYDPVDMSVFCPSLKDESLFNKYGIPSTAFLLMTVGRLERNKGHRTIINALVTLPSDICYVIVGGGFMREELLELARSLGVSDRVVFTGRVPEDDIVGLYNIADVVILISNFGPGEGEGLPLGLIEGAACSKPIICGNEDGSVEAIDRGQNGFLVGPKNTQEVGNAIMEYYNDRTKMETHGASGLDYVRKNFDYILFKSKLCGMLSKLNNI
jgi:phosphatidylinositol alpha-1,6-mannosyltransferase